MMNTTARIPSDAFGKYGIEEAASAPKAFRLVVPATPYRNAMP